MKTGVGVMAVAGGIAFATLAANGAAAVSLTGAGGTAIYPVLQVWAQKYQQKNGDEVNYQAIGSGGGIKQIESKTVDFANSDKPLMHDELATNKLVQFPQVVISIREKKKRKHKAYEDDLMGGIWISFAVAIFMLSWFSETYHVPQEASLYLIVYGVPTFATGYARRFRPMLIGGLACWVFAILSTFSPFPFTMLYTAAAAQLAWFIPGLILRRGYLKAKKHV